MTIMKRHLIIFSCHVFLGYHSQCSAPLRLRSLVLCLVLLTASLVRATAADAIRTVRVGVFSLPGYHEVQPGGERIGYGYEFLGLVQRYANLNFEFVGEDWSWDETLDSLRQGRIDLVTSVHKTESRLEEFDFSLPIGSNNVCINTRQDESRFVPYDFESYGRIRLGMYRRSVLNARVDVFARENGLNFTPCYYDSFDSLRAALSRGDVEAIVSSSLHTDLGMKSLACFDAQFFYACVQKGDTSLLRVLDEAIVQMNLHEGDWQNRLFQRNFKKEVHPGLAFTPEEQAFIRSHSTPQNPVVIAADNQWYPFSVKEGESYRGIIPECWQEILRMTGMAARFFDNGQDIISLSDLCPGKADIYIGPTYSPPVCSQQGFIVSPPLMSAGGALLYRKSSTQIHSIALCANTPILNSRYQPNSDVRVQEYPNSDAAIKALERGRVDAVFCYSFDAERIKNNNLLGNYNYLSLPFVSVDLRAVISQNSDHLLISIVSKCINQLEDAGTEAIISGNLTFAASDFRLRDWAVAHPYLSLLIALSLMAILWLSLALFIRLRIRNTVARRQEEQLRQIQALNCRLEENAVVIAESVKRAESANKAKSDFLFSMSHDIRTPMNAIIGFTHLMEKSLGDADKCRDYLMKIQKSSGFLLSLINNVLEMARIDSGKVVLEETPCDVQQARGQLESVYGEMMKQKHINFEVSNHMRAKYVFMDAVKMNQVFLNLISNAYKYTPEGGRVRVETVELPCDKPGCVTIRTKVSDTGIGMSKDYLPHLFEEFTRERTATDNKILGTGLGMPIVKKLVELMGGTIEVESEPGRGTTFTVTTTHRVAQQEVVSCEEHAEGSLPSLAGRRVLLAEDNDLNAEIAVAILQEAGLLVERAADGVECVRMLQQAPSDYFSLILMDIQMPRLNGYEAARQIRQLGDRAKAQVPILAMTANAFEEDRQNALKAGMNGHLAKPIDVPLLLKTISEFIVRS